MSDSWEQWGPIPSLRSGQAQVSRRRPFTRFRASSERSRREGESGAFRAPKGEEFPTSEPREGHCGNVGAKGQWGSPHETEISSIFIGLRVFAMSNLRNSSQGTVALVFERNTLSTRSAIGPTQRNRGRSLSQRIVSLLSLYD